MLTTKGARAHQIVILNISISEMIQTSREYNLVFELSD